MSLTKLQFAPGINTDTTRYSNTGGWIDSNLIRFRNGLPEKIGGWVRVYSNQTPISGICRKMYPWTTLAGSRFTGIATNEKLYVDNSSDITDITPLRRIVTLGSDPFSTTNGSSVVTVTDNGHGAVAGDVVYFYNSTSVGGLSSTVMNKANGYSIVTVIDQNKYTVNVGVSATSTANGGGSIATANYYFHRGISTVVVLSGWGSSAWGGATTPLVSFTATDPVTTNTSTNSGGKTTITVTTPSAHGAVVGDWVLMSGCASVGGVLNLFLSQAMQIATIPTSTSFTAIVNGTASSNATGGGAGVVITIYSAATGYGWGEGPDIIQTTYASGLWSMDNYGEDLVACPRDAVEAQTLGGNPISTTNNSNTVQVTQSNHGYSTGMAVILAGLEGVGGISALDINGTHIITVTGTNTYTFSTPDHATSTVNGGGIQGYAYLSTLAYWDIDAARAVSLSRMGSIYEKKYLPYTATEVLVSDINRHVIAFGTNPFDSTKPVDKMIIRFSDSNDPTNWDASDTTKTSGELRCSSGSYIVTALQNREEIIVWTDTSLYTMNYVGAPYTYGLQIVGTGFDIIGPNAKVGAGAQVYWMGLNNFYTYNGAVAPLPCTVRDYVFNDINRSVGTNVYCSSDSGNNEIIWFYPSSNATENDRYVVYNYVDGIWYYGNLDRTAWIDRGQYATPRAICVCGYLYSHEVGADDGSTNPPTPLNAYIQSSPLELESGDDYMFVSRVLPDLTFRNTTLGTQPEPVVKFTLKTQDFPGAPIYPGDTRDVERKPGATLTVNRFTNQVYTRLRTRSVSLRVESDMLGVNWRLGTPRMDVRKDGRK